MNRLQFSNGHLFLEECGALWLFDTGAPTSFGSIDRLIIAGEEFRLGSSYLGMTAATLTDFVSVECAGLLGADVLSKFDFILDAPNSTLEASTGELEYIGQPIPLDEFMGIPIVTVHIRGADYRMFFDTGAQISYFQHESLSAFPTAGNAADFYPGFGRFQTKTYSVDIAFGTSTFTLRCGVLPELLGASLMMAGVEGIVGNSIIGERRVGYLPRRRLLVL